MARPRNPKRDQAFHLWKESNGTRLLKDIAEELECSPTLIRKWKNQDSWDEKLNGNVTKRPGAPKGSKNARGNKGGKAPPGNQNAKGNRGGAAPKGNKNSFKTGERSCLSTWMKRSRSFLLRLRLILCTKLIYQYDY
ncbi:phage terminase small subunit-related protein [Bacillus safensis]|nr:phage terminase small subunit-related protein [Bacillus safensis]WHX76985.1 phage terminase small subunit-related protein [Bacillus safensis]WHX84442.1 phage terminase small subunit-related protein [Bacillus safensis]